MPWVWRSRMVGVGGDGIPLMLCLLGRVVIVFLRIPLALSLPAPSRPAPVERGGRSPYGKQLGRGGGGVWSGEGNGMGRTKWEGESWKVEGGRSSRSKDLSSICKDTYLFSVVQKRAPRGRGGPEHWRGGQEERKGMLYIKHETCHA
jgi:hypothetical protein